MPRKKSYLVLVREDVARAFASFDELWKEYEDGDIARAVHDQRVAVNRLRGYAMFIGMAGSRKSQMTDGIRGIREWQKRIGELRDVDVQLECLEKCRTAARKKARPAAAALQESLEEKRDRVRAELSADAKGEDGVATRAAAEAARGEFATAIKRLARKKIDPRRSLLAVAEPWLARVEALRHCQSHEALHDFRLSNKRLRFVLETLAAGNGGEEWQALVRERLRIVKETHTILGNLSDICLLGDVLRTARAVWTARGVKLDGSAAVLEEGRAALEAREFERWLEAWPIVSTPEFLGAVQQT